MTEPSATTARPEPPIRRRDRPRRPGRRPAPADVDLGRGGSSAQFAGELIQTAATVVGAAQALQRASAEAAGAILDPGQRAAGSPAAGPSSPASRRRRGFRTPFREDDGVLYLVDQRRCPTRSSSTTCRSAGEVAYAIREMVVRGAPAIGQVAAIGLA